MENELKYLEDLITFIGTGVRPIKAGKVLYPDKPKGFIQRTINLRCYAWNRKTALLHPGVADKYMKIANRIANDMSYVDKIIVGIKPYA